MKRIALSALGLVLLAQTANAGSYEGDYKKIEAGTEWLQDKWCGGTAKMTCDGRNCEIRIRNTKCDKAELYLEQDGNRFYTVAGSYETDLVKTGSFPYATYSGNIYIDLERANTVDKGPKWQWRTYWVNMVLKKSFGSDYEKICPNFKARY